MHIDTLMFMRYIIHNKGAADRRLARVVKNNRNLWRKGGYFFMYERSRITSVESDKLRYNASNTLISITPFRGFCTFNYEG